VIHGIAEESEESFPSPVLGGVQGRALGLVEQVGVASAAKQLGLHESQLYAWRKKARYEASRSKTEVVDRVPSRIHTVRSDHGYEFQAKFHWYLEDLGIRHVYIKPSDVPPETDPSY
jgi:transposase-like protein